MCSSLALRPDHWKITRHLQEASLAGMNGTVTCSRDQPEEGNDVKGDVGTIEADLTNSGE